MPTPKAKPPSTTRARAQRGRASFLHHVATRINDGTWPPGHQLPPERELVEVFGIARNTLRKALDGLERDGVVARHVGRGTFIAGAATASHDDVGSLISRIHGASPTDVMEVRLVLEPTFIELAAVRATSRDLRHIEHCLRESEKAVGLLEFEHWDGMLHQAILAASKNRLLADLYDAINGVRRQPEWEMLKRRSLTTERLKRYKKQHRQLVKALAERDAATAREVIRDHLIDVRAGLVGEPDPPARDV